MTKCCTLCNTARGVLVRCQVDATGKWHFVCPGACWKAVSGGVEDAKGLKDEYPYYRYGGMVCFFLLLFFFALVKRAMEMGDTMVSVGEKKS